MRTLRTREYAAAALVFALGGAIVGAAMQLPMGSVRLPGPGAFPLIIGLVLIGLAPALAIQAKRAGHAEVLWRDDEQAQASGLMRVMLACLLIAVFLLLLPVFGFLLTGIALLIALHVIGNGKLGFSSVAAGAFTAAAAYLLFERILGVPLPHGSFWAL